jgi:hypothetical protein
LEKARQAVFAGDHEAAAEILQEVDWLEDAS